MINILIDKNIDYKRLKELLKNSKIDSNIFGVNIETPNKNIVERPALAVLGITKLPMRLASKDSVDVFEKIKEIIGDENLGDSIITEEAVFHNYYYFLTEDSDILNKRDIVMRSYPKIKILKLVEFEKEMHQQKG